MARPYRVPLYRGMAFALLMIGVAVIFFANVYSGVLKRGWFREGTKTLYETGLIVGLSTLYLFAIQEGEGYSRTVLFLTGIFFFFLSYGTRADLEADDAEGADQDRQRCDAGGDDGGPN